MKTFLETLNIEPKSENDVMMMNPLKLAFLGDSVYETYVRTYIISKFVMTPHEMTRLCVTYVRAEAQAQIAHDIKPFLSEKEWGLIKRGRNQKTGSVPKNAQLSDYKYATGFEVLIGYLYLTHQHDRLYDVIEMAIRVINTKKDIGTGEANETVD